MDDDSFADINVRSASGLIEHDDHGSTASYDDWGTIPKAHVFESEEDNVIQFVDLDEEAKLSSEKTVLRRPPGGGGQRKGREKDTQKDSFISHPAFTPGSDDSGHSPNLKHPNDNSEFSQAHKRSPRLFVSEDENEGLRLIKRKTEPNHSHRILRKTSAMDGLKRARAIKTNIENNISVLMPVEKQTNIRRQVSDDPENQLIKELRKEQKMGWDEIASYLNQERRNCGEAASFTAAAVYSRFVMNAPRIATSIGEIGFNPKDYMHLRHPNQYTNSEGTGTISKAGKKRIKNYDNAKELKANVRKQIKVGGKAELETLEKTEQLMEAVAKVERNFWILVADEMERSTTKLYPPSALAIRYHAV